MLTWQIFSIELNRTAVTFNFDHVFGLTIDCINVFRKRNHIWCDALRGLELIKTACSGQTTDFETVDVFNGKVRME